MQDYKVFFIIIPLILFSTLLQGCSGAIDVTSQKSASPVVIDGKEDDWQGSLNTAKDGAAYGFKNDGENLYICLVLTDIKQMMPMFRGGLTIWLEPDDSKNTIGIKYPTPPEAGSFLNIRQEMKENGGQPDRAKMIQNLLALQKDILIVNGDNIGVYNGIVNNKESIEAKIDMQGSRMIYELKIPLASSKVTGFKSKINAGDLVTVRFENGEIERMAGMRGGNMDGEGPGGGMPPGSGEGGSGMSPGGGMGGMGGGRGMRNNPGQYATPINAEFKLTLVK